MLLSSVQNAVTPSHFDVSLLSSTVYTVPAPFSPPDHPCHSRHTATGPRTKADKSGHLSLRTSSRTNVPLKPPPCESRPLQPTQPSECELAARLNTPPRQARPDALQARVIDRAAAGPSVAPKAVPGALEGLCRGDLDAPTDHARGRRRWAAFRRVQLNSEQLTLYGNLFAPPCCRHSRHTARQGHGQMPSTTGHVSYPFSGQPTSAHSTFCGGSSSCIPYPSTAAAPLSLTLNGNRHQEGKRDRRQKGSAGGGK
jgi:hypothetical protein